MGQQIKIGGILNHSTVDWAKRVTSVVFFSGCQFRCPWCQNPSLVRGDGEFVFVEYVVSKILKTRKLISGVVITGGEPTLQREGLIELCERLRERALDIKLDTNGTNPELLSNLIEKKLIQAVSIDFKAPSDDFETFCKVTGTNNRSYFHNFKKTLELFERISIPVEYRTTIIPSLNDTPDVLGNIIKRLNRDDRFVLQQFSNNKDILVSNFKEFIPLSLEKMMGLAKSAKSQLNSVYIRTLETGDICV